MSAAGSSVQQSISELFRQGNKLNYEVEGQINEIYCGRDSLKDLSPLQQHIRNKI